MTLRQRANLNAFDSKLKYETLVDKSEDNFIKCILALADERSARDPRKFEEGLGINFIKYYYTRLKRFSIIPQKIEFGESFTSFQPLLDFLE